MAVQYSVTVRNAMLDAIETAVGASAVLKIFSGAVPANTGSANPAGELVSMTLPADWMAAAANGVKALAGSWTVAATGTGTAASYRIYASNGTTCHEQGTVTATAGGGDITLDNTSIAAAQTVTITSKTITAGNA